MKNKTNYWQIATVVLAVLFVLSLFNVFNFGSGNKAAGNAVSFINENLLSEGTTAQLQDVEKINGVYKISMLIDSQPFESYISPDGKLLFPSAVPLTETISTGATGAATASQVNPGDILEVSASSGVSIGPENSAITVIEFSDFQCPFCAIASGLPSWTSQYESQYGDLIGISKKVKDMAMEGKLKFVYVPMNFLGQESVYATQAALCADEQEKFWEMHDELFIAHDSKENNGKFEKDKLKIIASNINGLDTATFNDCLENDSTLTKAQSINQASNSVDVTGTPSFFVNGEKIPSSWVAISAVIGV
jgi:protein-disulfide isomerase